MNLFDIIAILLTLAALFGFLNSRFLKLEPSVGLLLISLVSSMAVMALHWIVPGLGLAETVRGYLTNIDFNEALMHGMLGFLLFAGALHADLDYFLRRRWTIGVLATVGLLLSTVLVAVMSQGIFGLFGLEASFLACLVFGSLISPTDPIAVMGTLKTLHFGSVLYSLLNSRALPSGDHAKFISPCQCFVSKSCATSSRSTSAAPTLWTRIPSSQET